MIATLRRSQLITTWGPGALLDLPEHAVIVSGLGAWPLGKLERILEPRLEAKLAAMTRATAPKLYAPPIDPNEPGKKPPGITVYRFPEWFIVREDTARKGSSPAPPGRPSPRARRLVHRRQLDQRDRYEGRDVVPTRFVRACRRGHVTDLDWRGYVHHRDPGNTCQQQLWLDESGTGGDIGDLTLRCECGASRSMYDATQYKERTLGQCPGRRPWLGANTHETCTEPSRLLIRTATNAYFPQVVSTLSLPNRGTAAEAAVRQHWHVLHVVTTAVQLAAFKLLPEIGASLAAFTDDEVLEAISSVRGGGTEDRPVKLVELDAVLAAEEGYGEDVPVDPNFHARRLPINVWQASTASHRISSVVQLHRLRIVSALAGFTRFEAEAPDIHGEYDTVVTRASLATEPTWFPAIEIRGEGIFLQLDPAAIREWSQREAVRERLQQLVHGHALWMEKRQREGTHPGAAYILLHTLSHLLMQSLAMHAGYPASSIAERIYVDEDRQRYGILLYTGSNDADGTLGGLVGQAKQIDDRLNEALRSAALCSNDPICAQHTPDDRHEDRWLHGAACHGCSLIAETSCEMRNDHLDRALLVPILGLERSTAFFEPVA